MNNKFLSILKFIIGWPISLIALFFIFKVISEKSLEVIPKIINLNILSLFYGFIFFIGYFFIRSAIWQRLLKNHGFKFPLKEVSYLWGISELKRYIPGNIWSFIVRTLSFNKKGVDKKTLTKLLIIEVELVIISSLFVSLFSANFIFDFIPIFINKNVTVLLFYLFTSVLALIFILKQKFSIHENIILLALSSLAMFSFGLGTYFSAYAIFPLDPRQILILLAFFVFSLLVGFLSIVTPMGLGVREGVMTIGLSRIISLEIAGIISIFTRLILIISEVIFILIVWLWNNSKLKIINKTERFIRKSKHELLLFVFIIFYFHYFTLASFLRFDNFYTGKFDLGNMSQTVWNTLNGNFFMFTDPNGTEIISRLAFHADFILILLTPFYFIWQNPKMLLLIQTAVISIGAIYIYLIANYVLKSKNISLIFVISYLINPLVNYVNLYDFHAVSFAITFLLASFYYILRQKFSLFLIFSILAGLTKEQVWLISGILAIYFIIKTFKEKIKTKHILKIRALGFLFSIICFFLFYYLVTIAIPNAYGNSHFALSYYSEFGESPGEVIKNILISPAKTLGLIFQEKQINYLYNLFLPVGFLSFLSPLYLIFAIPDLGINLLSSNKQLSDIYYQYTSSIIPFIFISSIYGFKYSYKKVDKKILAFYFLIFSLLASYYIGPLPFSKNPNTDMFTKELKNKKEISKFLDTIPIELSVAATNNLGAYLSNREKLSVIPVGVEKAEIVLFLLNDSSARPSLDWQRETANEFENNVNYKLLVKNGDFVAFKKINLAK